MANLDHVEIVKQGVNVIDKWRSDNPGIIFDLRGAILSNTDLEYADLREADLTNADLIGANLNQAILSKTDLSYANLTEATLSQAIMIEAKTVKANLSKAKLYKVRANKIDLSRANLSDSNLIEANLTGAYLWKANLCRGNLNDASLSGVYLGKANLCNANLISADVIHGKLSKAILRGADLTNADLSYANLEEANLNEAILHGVKFASTNLSGTSIDGADLEGAYSLSTLWGNIDLSRAKSLQSINHHGPSTVGVDTLMRSQGKIPEAFLRGCGFSDEFISYTPSHFSGSAIDFYSCFISYSHEDKAFARRLHDTLQGRGIRCWLDEHQILPGDNIYERIDHGIRVWDKVLFCASKNSLTSGWVDDELKHAFAKEKQLFKDRGCEVLSLIPLNLDGYLFSDWNHPKKNQVLERMAPDFTGWEKDNAKFEQQFERVVKALQTNDTGREPEPKSKL